MFSTEFPFSPFELRRDFAVNRVSRWISGFTMPTLLKTSANMLVHSHENYPLPDTTLHKYVLDRISTIAQKDSERKAFVSD